jgi:peptide/nickel transport system ATP-binding protein
MSAPVLEVAGLVTSATGRQRSLRLLDDVGLEVAQGEFIAVVGESGSGKSMLCLSIAGLLPDGVVVESGQIRLAGRDLLTLRPSALRRVRGRELSMVFQDPLSSLSPTMRVGEQIMEPLRIHKLASRAEARNRARELLDLVGFDSPQLIERKYPHELSGGMRQRVAIAIALACVPKVLIADEPTTALDATVQVQVLELLKRIQKELHLAVVFVSHDLRAVSHVADRIVVMYAGREVESGPAHTVIGNPRHRYTQALLSATPNIAIAAGGRIRPIAGSVAEPGRMPLGCRFNPRCHYATSRCTSEQPPLEGDNGHRWACWHPADSLRIAVAAEGESIAVTPAPSTPAVVPLLSAETIRKTFRAPAQGIIRRRSSEVVAVDGVSLEIHSAETLGLVGESGSGKSTLGRILVALDKLDAGIVRFDGVDIFQLPTNALRSARRDFQMMFQDSYSSLDRRMRVAEIVEEPLAIHGIGAARGRRQVVAEMLERVSLPASAARRLPRELSGGQRQRVGLARALMLEPRLVVADEPVSSLDVSVQATILNLMQDLQAEKGLSYLFISHDLAVVRYMADRIAVMYQGRVVELGDAASVYSAPLHPYTNELLEAVEGRLNPRRRAIAATRTIDAPEGRHGCLYRNRCAFADQTCVVEIPKLEATKEGHAVACHHPLREQTGPKRATDDPRSAKATAR